jgi:glycosyltransferase involved in cell wall biosynthesis
VPISAILLVYNEEKRIEFPLRSATWCDEINVLDKQSTDRTRQIARQFTDKVYTIPYSEFGTAELQYAMDTATNEWILWLTGSDVLHPHLAAQIRELIEREDFPYDVIHVPYRRYVLGLETKRSPWYSEFHPAVFRKRVVRIRADDVHAAITFNSDRQYKMPYSDTRCMYHLTHETVDGMMERHLRYWRADARLYPAEQSLANAAKWILSSIRRVFFQKKSFLMGWDGFALGMAFITYMMMNFVYIWEKRRSKATQIYREIRETVMREWKTSSLSLRKGEQ